MQQNGTYNWIRNVWLLPIMAYFGYEVFSWSHLFTYVAGLITSLILSWYFVLRNQVSSHKKHNIGKKFKFMDQWELQTESLQSNYGKLPRPFVQESSMISETIEEFIDLVTGEFIDPWFKAVSSNLAFTENVKLEMLTVILKLTARLKSVNFSKLLVSKMLPVVNTHFRQFLRAESKLSSGSELQLAQLFPLHKGVTIDPLEKEDYREKVYLRERIRSILPYILSDEEKNNDISLSFVTEILACTILVNVFNLVADPDFHNVLIIKLIGDNLKHRDQVKQLRAALEEHTSNLSKKMSLRSLRTERELIDAAAVFTITKDLDDVAFKEICSSIEDIKSLDELRSVKRSILFQLKQVSTLQESEKVKLKLNKRLQLLKAIVNEKLDKSSNKYGNLQNHKLLDVLSTDYDSFMLFMAYRKREILLQFWKDIERIKVPLENGSLSISLEFSTLQEIRGVPEKYFDSALIPVTTQLKSEFEKLDTTATVEQYMKCRNLLFNLQEEVFNEMETVDLPLYVTSTYFTKTPLGNRTRKISLALLGSVDVDTNGADDERGDDDVSAEVVQAVEDAFTEIMKNPTGLNKKLLTSSGVSNSKHDSPLLSESSSKENVRHSLFYNDNDSEDRLFEDSTISSSKLEGNDSSIDLLDLANDRHLRQYENRNSRLFETESISDTDSITSDSPLIDSIELEENTEGSQVFLAAPGDLSLAEQISKLSQELESLNEQLSVLEPLLRKASLTNNVGELKILRKSKVSLEREIKYKELQMHQYIVQENDNSLYAKSRVSIQSYVVGNDEKQGGKEFVLYIIEVQKFGDDPNLVTAGWIVARRFSQFFKLNEYLRIRYDQVNQLKFPKRTVLKAQRQLVESRKTQLEEYLKQLIGIPEVCSDKVFRSFLSSENFNLTSNFEKASSNNNAEYLMKRIYKITERFGPKSSEHDTIDNLRDMQKELKQFDDSSKSIFVKPICDILITIFRLSKSQSWLRGRALVVILQQVFGTTIEKMVHQQVDKRLRDETAVLDLLVMLKNIVFPNGKFKDPPILRTMYERSTARKEARILTTIFINESCSKIFGASNSNYASQKLFAMVQNQYLNKHLLFTIFDEILTELFPEG